MRIAFLETAAVDEPGSMRRYGDMLEEALHEVAEAEPSSRLEIFRVNLAPASARLSWIPKRYRMWAHHAVIVWNAFWMRKSGFDLFHVLDGSRGFVARLLPGRRTVCTSHDIIPWLQSQGEFPVPRPGTGARWIINQSLTGLRRCAVVISVSQATERDLRRAGLSQTPIRVIHHAILPSLLDHAMQHRQEKSEDPGAAVPYIFHVGNNGFYKNRAGVIRIFARLRHSAEVRLIMAGPPPAAELRSLVEEAGVGDQVTFVVDPSDEELKELYSNASLLLFPSYYEGFGWPPLEAMACGCPVVTSNRGSLPEIVGDAGLIADPDDHESFSELCRKLLTEPETVEQLRKAGYERIQQFSLRRMGSRVLEIYRQVESANHVGGESIPCLVKPQGSLP